MLKRLSVIALALGMMSGAQAAPLLTNPQEVSVGAYPARSIFLLDMGYLDARGAFSVHWGIRFLTAGEVKVSISSDPIVGLQITEGGVYLTNENYESPALVAPMKMESLSFTSDWTYISPGFFLFSITGLAQSPGYIFSGVGILRAQSSTSNVPTATTLALLGLGLAGMARHRSSRSTGKGAAR